MDLKFRRLRARGRLVAIPLVAAAAVAGAATTASASTQHASSHASISKSELTTLKNYVAKAQLPPAWTAPGPPVNAKKALKGKTIVTFPISSNIDACNTKGQQGYFADEAKALGANVISLPTGDNPGGPPTWISNLQQAVNDKASAIVMLCGPTAAAMSSEIAAVNAKHIPIVSGNYNQTGGSPAFPTTGVSAESGVNTEGGVSDDLADALINLNGKPAHILFLDSTDVAQYQGAYDTLQADVKKWCPSSCSIQLQKFTSAQWATGEQSVVATDLQGNSSVNTVITAFDGMSDDIVSDVEAAAKSHPGLKIYAWGGGVAEIHNVNSNPVMAADSGPDERWDAFDQLDQVIRLLAGKKAEPVNNEIAPNIFFTKSNASTFYSGDNYSDKAYSDGAFIKDFEKLWGVS